MDMYKSEKDWENFCLKMNQIFDIENNFLPYNNHIITQTKQPDPWNKGKYLGEEWSNVRKQRKLTPEQYQKIINHLNNLRQSLYTLERNKKISESLIGVPHTEERKRNVSISKTGTKHSEETKRKIATSLKGKKRGPYKKKHAT